MLFASTAVVLAWGALGNDPMPLELIPKQLADEVGAKCLDGSRPGFYFAPASTAAANTSWVLYIKGGGWCYDEKSCLGRAATELGNATMFPSTFEFSGMMDSNASVNPTFYDFNRVVLWYCDGASWSGDREKPTNVDGTDIWFRGRRNLVAIIRYLMETKGLDRATDVLLSGGSAGGLSTFLHADYVKTLLPSTVKRYKAAPVSGFFLLHDSFAGEPVYPSEMEYVYNMQNSSGGVNARCAEAAASGAFMPWKCIFANYSYSYTEAPIFPLNSAIDSWQMGNVFKFDKNCAKEEFKHCTADQINSLNGYMSDFLRDMTSSPAFSKAGNGAFVESCLEHCGTQTEAGFDGYTIQGVTAKQALGAWWNSPVDTPAAKNTYVPGCTLSDTPPHQCNPTCGK